MIISVASGKGGTGKTSVAIGLAQAIGNSSQILDCDVEEPNVHLFLKPEITNTSEVTLPVPVVDATKCTVCGECVEICRFRAIVKIADTILAFPDLCHGCGGCMVVCPEKAIVEKALVLGKVELGHSGELDFGHGILDIGKVLSPPVIRAVRAKAKQEKTVIIDAPPGTSCPMIAAVKGTDFVLLVTEPTPFGLHDLRLAHGAVRLLGIPCGLVINRSDVGNDEVKDYALTEGLPLLMEIPFSREIAEGYSRGETIIEVFPEWKDKFLKLYEDVCEIASGKEVVQ